MPQEVGFDIGDALRKVGELLALDGESYAIVIVGGAALNLLGIVHRLTKDVDILAFAPPASAKQKQGEITRPPEPLPEPLTRAAATVARDLGLRDQWLNAGPAPQWREGLPSGLEKRIQWRRYAALNVGLVDRYDLIFLKLYAAADDKGTDSVHYQDLLALSPKTGELRAALEWVKTQDASAEFRRGLQVVVDQVRADLHLDG
jgi:hypothetical protein